MYKIPSNRRYCGALTLAALTTVGLVLPLAAHADKMPQRLSATVDGKLFESDDSGILYLVPIKGVLNLMASTKGAGAYPPPKTPVDRLSISCKGFDGKPVKFSFPKSGYKPCEISFTKGDSNKPLGDPLAEYRLADGNHQMEITSVKGKVIEGTFSFEMVDIKTKAKMAITGGTFKAEDRQL